MPKGAVLRPKLRSVPTVEHEGLRAYCFVKPSGNACEEKPLTMRFLVLLLVGHVFGSVWLLGLLGGVETENNKVPAKRLVPRLFNIDYPFKTVQLLRSTLRLLSQRDGQRNITTIARRSILIQTNPYTQTNTYSFIAAS